MKYIIALLLMIPLVAGAAVFKFGGIKFDVSDVATSGGTTTLTKTSRQIQSFTGSSNQTVVLPDATTLLETGWWYIVSNNSTGVLTIQDAGANTLGTIPAAVGGVPNSVKLVLRSVASANGVWDFQSYGLTTGIKSRLDQPNIPQTSNSATGNIDALSTASSSAIRLTGAAPVLRGIANGSDGKIVTVTNASGSTITISNENAGPSAANRILTGNGADSFLANNASIAFQYDSTSSRWRVLRGSSIDLSQSSGVGSSVLSVANGGTGQSTYTDGQILIGNSSGNTLTKSTLTAGSGVTITNGPGAITIAASGGSGSSQLAGWAYFAGTNGCEPVRASTSFGTPTDDADCPGPTIVVQNLGTWQTTDANNISVTVDSLPAGKYIGYMNVYMGRSTGGNACQFYLTDGTTNGTIGATRGATDTFAQSQSMAYFNYASSGNRTFYTQLRSHDGTNCFLFNYNSANSAFFETSFVLLKIQD